MDTVASALWSNPQGRVAARQCSFRRTGLLGGRTRRRQGHQRGDKPLWGLRAGRRSDNLSGVMRLTDPDL
jgi:hypothetical protein